MSFEMRGLEFAEDAITEFKFQFIPGIILTCFLTHFAPMSEPNFLFKKRV